MLNLNQIENGRLTYKDNSGNVTCVCFSPDGTALGTGTDKGEIKFFSINFDQPKTCRFHYSSIDSAFHLSSQLPILKASIDLTSHFLVPSDIHRNSMYVLTIYQDAENNRAYFSSINAFTSINSPSLSFAITAANQITREHSDLLSYGVKMYSIHTKVFQELLLVFKTNRFMMINPLCFEQDDLLEDFRFEPYISYLRNGDLSLSTTTTNNIEPTVGNLMTLPPYSIDDLLTPNSSLTNITGLPNGDTARSLLASHDVNKSTNRHSLPSTMNNTLPTNNPLHGLLFGNTTAFDAVTIQQQPQGSSNVTNSIFQSSFDLDDKEVAESMSHTTNYPLQFEALPNDEHDDVGTVFMPIKTNGDDEPVEYF
ncbi:unnamed protein product [Rotaria sordida]|uniref:Uncharacterized protein n=1 Tax=Rotaria sordida TaxID=392033 RepID=A0A815B7F7_9BILA|nr:unnamed protein product [Rotaria sordida]CAF1545008.1 unnamed protein product [Rotaria sordida]